MVIASRSHSSFLRRSLLHAVVLTGLWVVPPMHARAQAPSLSGRVLDQTGQALPGVSIQVVSAGRATTTLTATNADGRYAVLGLPAGTYDLTFSAINFAEVRRRHVSVTSASPTQIDVTLQLSLSADVVVTAIDTFRNLADIENPAENLVGVANAASEGAVTGRQLESRPVMRAGEVLEAVPGVIVSQ